MRSQQAGVPVGERRHETLPEMRFDSAGCCCLHPFLGWLGSSASKMSETSTAPVANCSQLGRTKPASSRVCTLDTTPMKLGDACCSSNARRIVVDTSGWRSSIILTESAQLAQCAACRKRTLLRMPRPPSVRGNVATALADSGTASTGTCKRSARHAKICESCL